MSPLRIAARAYETNIESIIARISDETVRSELNSALAELRSTNGAGNGLVEPGVVAEPAARIPREYLLSYADKQPEADILLSVPALPIQRVRTFGAVSDDRWHNMLVQGDNLPVLRRLMDLKAEGRLKNADGSDGVRLVYIDPPFASDDDYETKAGKIAYADKVRGAEFIEGLRKRLVLIREIVADDASVFVHLDWRKSHYIKAVMDEVFGEHNFINEIVWHYRSFHGQTKNYFPRKHDVLLFYGTGRRPFSLPRKRVPLEELIDFRNWGKYIVNGDEIRGDHYPSDVRFKRNLDKWLRENPGRTPGPHDVLYKFQSQPEDDTWDIPYLDPKDKKERLGYPTQKPEALLERVITSASREDDLVLDCFAGSGTALAVAEKLGRRWIGVDLGLSAVYTMQKRLLNISRSQALGLLPPAAGKKAKFVPFRKPPRPFAVYTSGHYDFQRLKAMPFADYRAFVLRLFEAKARPSTINGIAIDGAQRGDPVIVFDFHAAADAQVTAEYFDELASFLEGRVNGRVLFIAPAASLALFEDRITARGVEFDVRRVPYSVVAALAKRPNQPTSEDDINLIIETEGFDFAIPPAVTIEVDAGARELRLTGFRSRAIVKGLTAEQRGFPALAMVLIDYDYDGSVFDLDKVVFAEQVEEWGRRVALPDARQGKSVAVSFCDIFGNEHFEVLPDAAWGQAG